MTDFTLEKWDRKYIQDVARYAGNAGSCGVLEKAGFTLEGELRKNVYRNGQFHSSRIYGLLRNDG